MGEGRCAGSLGHRITFNPLLAVAELNLEDFRDLTFI